METGFLIFLLVGMVAMFIVMMACGKVYKIELLKIVATAVILMPAGYYGAQLMYHVETGYWGGRSLYGAIFLVPVVMLFESKALNIKYGELMDVCAPAGCIMFALLKIKCQIDGCCGGRLINIGEKHFVFPSQIVECAVLILIMAFLVYLIFRNRNVSQIYPFFMIIYGATRFFLNLLRETTPWLGPIPAGNVWSILSVVLGIGALIIQREQYKKTHSN